MSSRKGEALDHRKGWTRTFNLHCQLVWFCVPTVALAIQQHKAISIQLPAFQARVLSGADDVDLWTEQWIWDEILRGIRIVVSTHQVRKYPCYMR